MELLLQPTASSSNWYRKYVYAHEHTINDTQKPLHVSPPPVNACICTNLHIVPYPSIQHLRRKNKIPKIGYFIADPRRNKNTQRREYNKLGYKKTFSITNLRLLQHVPFLIHKKPKPCRSTMWHLLSEYRNGFIIKAQFHIENSVVTTINNSYN